MWDRQSDNNLGRGTGRVLKWGARNRQRAQDRYRPPHTYESCGRSMGGSKIVQKMGDIVAVLSAHGIDLANNREVTARTPFLYGQYVLSWELLRPGLYHGALDRTGCPPKHQGLLGFATIHKVTLICLTSRKEI